MKKCTQSSLFLAVLFCTAFTSSVFAQDIDQEMVTFAQGFQDAYNQEDHAALKAFYTDDAVRVAQDGSTISGAEAIRVYLETQFKGSDATLTLRQESVNWSDFNHAYVSKGTFHVKGTSINGDRIDVSGKYSNVMIQVNGTWKMSKSFLEN